MNQHHQNIANLIQQFESLTAEQKNAVAKSLKDADKELEIASFKLERTEKVKRTTAILLEETIQELEQKRKAVEEQNRELEIEAALEKVRSRTMGMQKSEELSETAVLLFHQLKSLGLDLKGCGFNIWEKDEKICTSWMNGPDGTLNPPFKLPLTEDPFFIRYYESRQNGEDFWVYETSKEEMSSRYQYLRTLPVIGELLAKDSKDGSETEVPSFVVDHVVNFSNGNLIFVTYKAHPEAWDIFKRFGKVFEQTYTRFLDLQKAEAQARESQIQLAMERVRARTMAMQRSDELPEAANLLFQQVQLLGMPTWSAGYCIFQEEKKAITAWMSSEGEILPPFRVPLTEEATFIHMREGWEKGEPLYLIEISGEVCKAHYEYMRTLPSVGKILDTLIEAGHPLPTFQIMHMAYFSQGCLLFITYEPVPHAHDIFKRFAKVFEQTYTRFLDLQTAEAQARESQIQLALERVRARTMAMQKSEELNDVAGLLFKQVTELGIVAWTTGFNVWSEDNNSYIDYITSPNGGFIEPYTVYTERAEALTDISNARKSGVEFDVQYVEGEKIKQLYLALMRLDVKQYEIMLHDGVQFPSHQYEHFVFGSKVSLMFITYEPVPEAHDIFKRFGKVFEQTYTRFLDLKKAEAQAREAQIEAALERIRAKSMAMRQSDELTDLSLELAKQVQALGVATWHCAFNIYDDDQNCSWEWGANAESAMPIYKTPREGVFLEYYELGQKGETLHINEIGEDKCADHYEYLCTLPGVGENLRKVRDAGIAFPKSQIDHVAYFKYGYLLFITFEPAPAAHDIFKRFAKVFEQTYTRFLDLKQAEAQAREAQIETALERVRSRTMGMQKSEELKDIIQVVYDQFTFLNIHVEHAGFIIDYKARSDMFIWLADRHAVPNQITIPYFDSPHWNSFNEAKAKGQDFFANHLPFEDKNLFYEQLFKLIPRVSDEVKDYYLKCAGVAISTVLLDNVGLYIENFSAIPYTEEENNTLMRFGKVFQQTYTRFLDLQKAEEQTREAQVEAVLERTRTQSMLMQHSRELDDTLKVFHEQVLLLGIDSAFSYLWLPDELNDRHVFWASWAENGLTDKLTRTESTVFKSKSVNFALDRNEPATAQCLADWKTNDPVFSYFVQDSNVENYFAAWDEVFGGVEELQPEHFSGGLYYVEAFMKYGCFGVVLTKDLPEAEKKILSRLAVEFERAYTRFLDLQKAESQAREAIKRASVDRVRGDIASMRTTSDLERIQPLIWNELTTLGVPFIRCGVFIMDEQMKKVHTFLSTPEGKAIATLHVPFDFNLSIIFNGVSHWREKKIYKEYWDATAFAKSWIALSSLRETSAVSSQQEKPPEHLHLHLLPFLQGMMYVGNDAPLNEEELQSVQNLADAFATAYARYEDFNKLESAKVQIEKTLVDLKQAQSQLIQSEKMASLGELTAGIAHEIQNPLNFVNNFSEVNKELLAELHEAIEKEDYEEVKVIAKDISGNEEKISHHGRRADAIVKGMLQHSRTSVAIKEPTDINKLADEYLRLAYHGLRAKDKSFNATLKTEYDESIGNINVIPQDIGRAILNLITNAFYVVSEKKKQSPGGYESIVSVSTKMAGNKVEVSVKDNGNGIPQKVLDKIFQPFFTTKPTGQGTGLGLSLTYDIIKAHGGEIKVKTSEGEGTTFNIYLPVTNV